MPSTAVRYGTAAGAGVGADSSGVGRRTNVSVRVGSTAFAALFTARSALFTDGGAPFTAGAALLTGGGSALRRGGSAARAFISAARACSSTAIACISAARAESALFAAGGSALGTVLFTVLFTGGSSPFAAVLTGGSALGITLVASFLMSRCTSPSKITLISASLIGVPAAIGCLSLASTARRPRRCRWCCRGPRATIPRSHPIAPVGRGRPTAARTAATARGRAAGRCGSGRRRRRSRRCAPRLSRQPASR